MTAVTEDFVRLSSFGSPPDHSRCEPMSIEDFKNAQETLYRTIEFARMCQSPPESFSASVMVSLQRLLSRSISWKLSNVRPRLHWNEQAARWQTAWDIGSLEAAIYLIAVL